MMDNFDYDCLWMPVVIALNGTKINIDDSWGHRRKLGLALDQALGINEFEQYLARPAILDEPMPDGPLKTLLKTLSGPHGKAILRAYQIKHNLPITELDSNEKV